MSVKVRFAEVSDLPALVDLGRTFHAESPYSEIDFSSAALLRSLKEWLVSANAAMFVADNGGELVGACCTIDAKFYFSDRIRFATEMFWFVHPDYRSQNIGERLLDAMEQWADSRGCMFNAVIAFGDAHPNKYFLSENTYMKRLS